MKIKELLLVMLLVMICSGFPVLVISCSAQTITPDRALASSPVPTPSDDTTRAAVKAGPSIPLVRNTTPSRGISTTITSTLWKSQTSIPWSSQTWTDSSKLSPSSPPPPAPTSLPADSESPVPEPGNTLQLFRVHQVIDGDTIEVISEEKVLKVRYIGIDTPETISPNITAQPYGKETSNQNKELVEGKYARLEKDVSETDWAGRLLRYVYVDDLFVNAELLRLGCAKVHLYPPDEKYRDIFLQLEKEAKNARVGIWGLLSPSNSPALPDKASQSTADAEHENGLNLEITSITSPVKPGMMPGWEPRRLPGHIAKLQYTTKAAPVLPAV